MLKVYAYQGCSTCRQALKWLRERQIAFEEIAIRETPPAPAELAAMLRARGDLRMLFNTSGLDYRAMDLKTRLPLMSESEALQLLATHGNLVIRPFALDPNRGIHLTGFKEPEWKASFEKA